MKLATSPTRKRHSPVVYILRQPAVRLLLAFTLFYVGLLQYGRANFYRDPGSVFYDESRAFRRHYSALREREAGEFIERHAAAAYAAIGSDEDDLDWLDRRTSIGTDMRIPADGKSPTICANFITVKRDGVQYIDNSIGSMLVGLTPEEREDLYLSVFFANTEPGTHPTYHQPWLRRVVDSVYSYRIENQTVMENVRNYEAQNNVSAKGVFDYTYGLQQCYNSGAPYVLMLEGDLILADGWLVRTLRALADIEHHIMVQNTRKWLYLRLFNQERSTGWSNRHIGGNNEHWISIGAALAILACVVLARRNSPTLKAQVDDSTLAVICLICVPALVVLFFQAGKASILPPTPGVFEQSYGCCSQALLYPRRQVPGLIAAMNEWGNGQVDLLVNEYARNSQLSRLSLYPVPVQHVGVNSVRGTRLDEARAIFSMAFEKQDPVRLRSEHQQMLAEVYGGDGLDVH